MALAALPAGCGATGRHHAAPGSPGLVPARLMHRHGGGECPAAGTVRKALAAIGEATVAQ
jgi:hypothetical protein